MRIQTRLQPAHGMMSSFLVLAVSIVGGGVLLLQCGGATTPRTVNVDVDVGVDVGVNWGTQSSHPLPPQVVAKMLKSNGIRRVKLFGDDGSASASAYGYGYGYGYGAMLRALAVGMEVMVGISNGMLRGMAVDPDAANAWVQNNVVRYTGAGSDIRYVAVGNEPYLQAYNGTYAPYAYPALRNVQMALDAAGLGSRVKATVPLNANVLSPSSRPSHSAFRPDIAAYILPILQFLALNDCPFTINIYPYLSLYADKNFPVDYAFFSDNANADAVVVVADGAYTYRNVFDASYDSLVVALSREGYGNMSIIVGEIGWPTDGDVNANVGYAQKFNQGLVDHLYSNAGTPRRPNQPIHVYLFSLLDEDLKSLAPGNFERHWGIFSYDGKPKYSLSWRAPAAKPKPLVGATGVKYLKQRWCILDTSARDLSALGQSVAYACSNSDCTSLGYGCSCNQALDANGNASYAFNEYFQRQNQDVGACSFNGLGRIVTTNPSTDGCTFILQLAYTSNSSSSSSFPCKLTTFLKFFLASFTVATLF